MSRPKPNVFDPSRGERSLAIAYTCIAIGGAGLAFTVMNHLAGGADIFRPLSMYDWWVIVSGAIGAFGGLYIGRDWLGNPGFNGLARALVAIPVISLIGTLIAGTLALPGHGTMFGPLGLLTTLIANPLLALIWCSMILGSHYRFSVWRREVGAIDVSAYATSTLA